MNEPEELERRTRQLEVISRATLELNSVLELRQIMRKLVTSALEMVTGEAGTWGRMVDGRMLFTDYVRNGEWTSIDIVFDPSVGVPGHVMVTREPYISNHPWDDEHVLPHLQREYGFYNLIDLPILGRSGELLGCLELHNKQGGRPYDQEDVRLLSALAAAAAVALENARLVEQARRAIQLRDEFMATASHELRTPLTTLKLQAQRLEHAARTSGGTLPAQDVLQRSVAIDAQLTRLGTLVESMISVAELYDSGSKLTREPFDLVEMVRPVLDRWARQLQAAGCSVTLDAPDPVDGRWDRGRLEQLFEGLLSNALKYGSGRPIAVCVRAKGDTAMLSVRDEGIGIAPEDHARIFERFQRAVPTQQYGGLGLGLFIARQVAEAHGGNVRVESEPAKGATFTVELPRALPGRSIG